jgi:hypothetical protein
MQTVKCPNCGASATNFKNCEFCGSLFVRMIDKKIGTLNLFSEDNFNGFIFSGLKQFLEQNIELQSNLPGHFIVTDITYNNEVCLQIVASSKIQDLLKNEKASAIGLAIHVPFDNKNSLDYKRFLQFKEHILFSHSHDSGFENYAIDYGSDIEGAAYLSSKLLTDVFLIPSSAELQYKTSDYDEVPSLDSKNSNCFIATAAMGSYDHPLVVDLRRFRDNWILTKSWGHTFVKIYYKYGAMAAKKIEKYFFLKWLVYILVLKPLAFISKKIERKE